MASFLDISSVSPIIDELVQKLENDFQIKYRMNVSEIVKGGSLGHGTAVPGKFDLDLVLYSRDILPQDVIRNGVEDVLNDLDTFLKRFYKGNYVKDDATPFALQFTLYGILEVDLLPSPFWSSSHEFVTFMERIPPRDRRKFQCSEAKWQKEFLQRQPNEEYIKRAKKWRDKYWPKGVQGTGRPKSFLLELLVIEAYDRVGRNDPRAITQRLYQMVKNHRCIKVSWVDDGAIYDQNTCRPLYQTPCILDPANPFNNLYKSGLHPYKGGNIRKDRYNEGDGDWTNMVKYIGQLDLSRDDY